MARFETKSLSVVPSNEQYTIELWEQFGWTLKSSQEIYSKDSHTETRGGERYSVTETTNYVKLVFQRDKDMANYDKIAELEKEYIDLENKIPLCPSGGTALIVLGIIAIIVGVIGIETIFLPIICIPGGIVSIVFGNKKKKAAKEKYDVEYKQHMEKMNAVLEKVNAYC